MYILQKLLSNNWGCIHINVISVRFSELPPQNAFAILITLLRTIARQYGQHVELKVEPGFYYNPQQSMPYHVNG